jgi:hypothetical protein
MRRVAKPCRTLSPAAFRALRMTFLIRNASPGNSVNRPYFFLAWLATHLEANAGRSFMRLSRSEPVGVTM